ncbi:MAG TPA: FlgD immunoglobulin-like domain containing protein [Gammaproteobacteria bacterium]
MLRLSRFVFFVFCLSGSTSLYALNIKSVSHYPEFIDFREIDHVEINYALDEAAHVVIKIYDDRDILINQLDSAGVQQAGKNTMRWMGDDFTGKRVPPEAYKYTITATSSGNTVEHDLSDLTGGKKVKVHKLQWDKTKNQVSYHVLKPARVNVRVGMLNNGPLMATLSDWLPREHGNHRISWNGLDNSGVFDLRKIEDNVKLYAEAFTLSENTILVGPKTDQVRLIEDISWKEEKRVRKKQAAPSMKNHGQQYIENRGDFTVNVVLPDDLAVHKSGIPIVSGIVPVRFVLPKRDNLRIINDRYEPILFVDGKYFVENEVGFFPMTWNLDTTTLTEGEHYLTINLRGYNGHMGAASARIFVKR